MPAGPTPVIAHGPDGDPGICTGDTNACNGGDLDENSLDVEWSGAVAPGAQIVLVTDAYLPVIAQTTPAKSPTIPSSMAPSGRSTMPPSPARRSTVRASSASVTESASSSTAPPRTSPINNLWQTAYAAGIAVFAATGDSGAASCDQGGDGIGNPYEAQYGLSVSALASSPYDTAVGGTDFTWCQPSYNSSGDFQGCSSTSASSYWNTSNSTTTEASAKGYVPEKPWNDTCEDPIWAAYLESIVPLVGASGVSTPEEACNFVYSDALQLYFEYDEPMLAEFVDTVGGSGGASNCVVNNTHLHHLGHLRRDRHQHRIELRQPHPG